MSELDEALVELRQKMDDPKTQSKYYDLFLNTTFFVPTYEEALGGEPTVDGQVAPLVLQSEGVDYLMLFDSLERLKAWAKQEVSFVEVPGHVLAAKSSPPLHWALNVETEFAKPFVPEEIGWLKQVVDQCNAEAAKGGA